HILRRGRLGLPDLSAIELDHDFTHHLTRFHRRRHPIGYVYLDLYLFLLTLLDENVNGFGRYQRDSFGHPALDRRVPPQSNAFLDRCQHAVVGKAFVENPCGTAKTITLEGCAHHHDDQMQISPLGTASDTEAGLVVEPGLDAIGSGELAQ